MRKIFRVHKYIQKIVTKEKCFFKKNKIKMLEIRKIIPKIFVIRKDFYVYERD